MKTRYIIIAVLSVSLVVSACSNKKQWEEALKQWEQAVKDRDEVIASLQEQLHEAKGQLATCQESLASREQELRVYLASQQPTSTPKPVAVTTSSIPQWAKEWQNTPYNERIQQSTVALIAVNPALKNDDRLQNKAINLEACVSETTKGETAAMFKSLAQCMTACVITLGYAE